MLVLIWDDRNIEHVERHMPRTVWEEAFYAHNAITVPHPDPRKKGRYIRESKVYGAHYRLVFAAVGPDAYRPITGHQIPYEKRIT